jgi:hypothetical protein
MISKLFFKVHVWLVCTIRACSNHRHRTRKHFQHARFGSAQMECAKISMVSMSNPQHADCLHLAAEGELADAAVLVLVQNHDLVGRVARVMAVIKAE